MAIGLVGFLNNMVVFHGYVTNYRRVTSSGSQWGLRPRIEKGCTRVQEKVLERFRRKCGSLWWEGLKTLVQRRVRFKRVPEKVPGSGEGLGG